MSETHVPGDDRGTDERWTSLFPMAYAMMEDIQAQTWKQFGIDYGAQYEWNIERAEIVFYRNKRPVARADLQFVGSISRSSGTWLWSWANESIPAQAKDMMSAVRQYGEEQGFHKLALPEWHPEHVDDGHDIMYVAASILGATATFHDHAGDLALYFTLHNFRFAGDTT